MHDVAALLASASVASILARALHLPPIPLLLLGGLVLSTAFHGTPDVLGSALSLGVSVLLFVVGLELDPRRLRAQRGAVVRVGLIQFAVLGALGYAAARALGLGATEAGYVALALPASSTLVGVRLLRRRQQAFEPFGRLVLGVLLLQDVLILLAIPLVTRLPLGWRAVVAETGAVLAVGALSLGVRRWVAPRILAVAEESELVLLAALAILFVFLGVASALGLPVVVGAFLAGAALSSFPVNGVVRGEVASLGDFFAAIFFTALGALLRMPTGPELVQIAVLAFLVVVLTPPLVLVVAERSGFGSKPAAEAGLLLAQTSEISLVVGLAGVAEGQISGSLFVVIAWVTFATMLLTPFLGTDSVARWAARTFRRRPRRSGEIPAGHVLLLGAGSTGMPLLEDLILAGALIVVVDDDPAIIDRLAGAPVRAIRGDASDRSVLRDAGADRARVVSSTIRRPRDNAALLEMATGPVLVRVFDDEDATWVRDRGGEPILYARATADGLMEWYEGWRDDDGP